MSQLWLCTFKDFWLMQLPGASIPPQTMMHFPPVSDFPLFSKNCKVLWKISKIVPFPPEKMSDFHPQKFLMTFFLVIDHKILNFPPILPVLVHFPPDWRKLLFPPYFHKFPPCFRKIHQLFTYFCVFFPVALTVMHLCITQCTYWTPLSLGAFKDPVFF